MAQVINTDPQVINSSWRELGRTVSFGALTGLIFWLFTVLVGRYIVEPLACQHIVNAATCLNATPLSGNIAAVLTAVAAIIFMVRAEIARPIIVAVATAAILWDLAAWTNGLSWVEAILWSVSLYAVSYAMFSWINRHESIWITMSIGILIVMIVRIAIAL